MSESSLSAHCPSPSNNNQYNQVIHLRPTIPITRATTIGSDYGTRLTYLRHSNAVTTIAETTRVSASLLLHSATMKQQQQHNVNNG